MVEVGPTSQLLAIANQSTTSTTQSVDPLSGWTQIDIAPESTMQSGGTPSESTQLVVAPGSQLAASGHGQEEQQLVVAPGSQLASTGPEQDQQLVVAPGSQLVATEREQDQQLVVAPGSQLVATDHEQDQQLAVADTTTRVNNDHFGTHMADANMQVSNRSTATPVAGNVFFPPTPAQVQARPATHQEFVDAASALQTGTGPEGIPTVREVIMRMQYNMSRMLTGEEVRTVESWYTDASKGQDDDRKPAAKETPRRRKKPPTAPSSLRRSARLSPQRNLMGEDRLAPLGTIITTLNNSRHPSKTITFESGGNNDNNDNSEDDNGTASL